MQATQGKKFDVYDILEGASVCKKQIGSGLRILQTCAFKLTYKATQTDATTPTSLTIKGNKGKKNEIFGFFDKQTGCMIVRRRSFKVLLHASTESLGKLCMYTVAY